MVYSPEGVLGDRVLLDPSAPAKILNLCRMDAHTSTAENGLFSLADLEKIYPKQGQVALDILLHFRYAIPVEREYFFIPSVLKLSPEKAVWCKNENFRSYGGRRVQCSPPLVFTTSFTAELQAEAHRLNNDIMLPGTCLSLWRPGGFKLPGRSVEALVQVSENCDSLDLLVRGQPGSFKEMRTRLVRLRKLVYDVILRFYPAARITCLLLSSAQAKAIAETNGDQEGQLIPAYSEEVYRSLHKDQRLPEMLDSRTDLLCSSSIACTLSAECRYDVIDVLTTSCTSYQKSWHDLAYYFQLPNSVISRFHASPENSAELLFKYLEDHHLLTVSKLVRGLGEIGRKDCVMKIREEMTRDGNGCLESGDAMLSSDAYSAFQ